MRKIIANIDCRINNDYYSKGEEIKNLTYEQIVKANELGYIEPLNTKELVEIEKDLKQPRKKEDL